jgi:hypothetical protein
MQALLTFSWEPSINVVRSKDVYIKHFLTDRHGTSLPFFSFVQCTLGSPLHDRLNVLFVLCLLHEKFHRANQFFWHSHIKIQKTRKLFSTDEQNIVKKGKKCKKMFAAEKIEEVNEDEKICSTEIDALLLF